MVIMVVNHIIMLNHNHGADRCAPESEHRLYTKFIDIAELNINIFLYIKQVDDSDFSL